MNTYDATIKHFGDGYEVQMYCNGAACKDLRALFDDLDKAMEFAESWLKPQTWQQDWLEILEDSAAVMY